jgi:glyoxylase-like metal-dependent hydrolase (beta-lactamase superfamily II)
MRVRPLLAGEIRLSTSFTACPTGRLGPWRGIADQIRRRDMHWAPVPVFLLEHPTEGPILVDTGYAADAGVRPSRTLGPATGMLFEHRAYDLDVLLERAGVRAADVGTVVMTHLHSDHASGAERFADHATFVADGREWVAGDRGGFGLRKGGYVPGVVRSIRRREMLDYRGPRARPLGPFAATIDLLGDGSVVLCSTPGHAPGHQSVLVRLGGGGELLLTGDAADLRSMVGHPAPTTVMWDRGDFAASLEAIRRYSLLHPQTVIVPGHDHAVWPELAEVYE